MSTACSLLQSKHTITMRGLSRWCEYSVIQRFGEKLRILRVRHGMTLRDLTRALGYVGSGYVSEVETGKRAPTAEFVLKVAATYG